MRDDFTFSYEARGRHDLRAGFEFVDHFEDSLNCNQCGGTIDARGTFSGAAIPSAAQLQAWFPDPFNADTWNFAAISPWVRTYTIGIGEFPNQYHQPKYGAWVQDDWRISDNLTLNLGLRYDLSLNSFANDLGLEYKTGQPPFYAPGRPNDTNNIQPRLGFAYQVDERTVIRGGSGLYYSDALTVDAFWPKYNTQLLRLQYTNPAQGVASNFAADPLAGQPLPTYAQAQSLLCNSSAQAANFAAWRASNFAGAAPCIQNALQEMPAPDEYMVMAQSWNSSIGIQRQLGPVASVEVDYIYTKGTNEKDTIPNVNLAYDPATGVNYPYNNANRARLPWPEMGVVSMIPHNARSGLRSLQTAFTKRMADRWQASATYTLSWLYSAENQPFSGLTIVPFDVADDLGNEYTLAGDDQRHRAVFSGIWEVGYGFQLSGLHYFGAGIRAANEYGGDLRVLGATGSARLRPNGSIVERNSYIQPYQNKTDLRIQQRVPLGGRLSIDLMAEVFNVFNRPNFVHVIQESNANYGKPSSGQYRTAQLGFRMTF